MNEIFKKEWELYQQAGTRPAFRGVEPKSGMTTFDAPVKVGEIRVFADMNRPFVAIVLEMKGAFGYRIMPVSPFTVPASSRELLVGERVYQAWNACDAAKSFVERSWIVETLDAADVADLKGALEKVPSGAQSTDETAVAYEKAFRVAGGNFRFQIDELAKVRTAWWRRRASWGIAAMLMLCCGIGGLWYETLQREFALVRHVSCAGSVSVGGMERGGASVSEVWDDDGLAVMTTCPVDSGEKYAEAEENEFQNPTENPLSTFGLDVDTSSYTLMRSSLADYKLLPNKDSVRIEEYVNYFKYAYPQPKGDAPVAVACELAACPWNAAHKLLRLGVQAKTVDDATLPPCNLTFLVDVSGSMWGGDRIGLLQESLKMLVGKLRDEDHVAIVTYANDTRVALPSVSGREKKAIGDVIDSLVAGGGTAGGAGLDLAYKEAQKNFDKKANNRVILVTDGDFNIGIDSPEELEKFIAVKRASGIFLSVFGVGRGNFMDANMKKLANAGNGNYAYLDSRQEAKKVMVTEFGGTLMTVAKDVKVQVEFNPSEVEGYRLLGYENRKLEARDFNDDKKDAGEIGAGHTMTAFYEIVPAGSGEKVGGTDPLKYQKHTAVGDGELCTVKLRYKLPDADKSTLVEEAHKAADITRKEPSEDFRFASAVTEFALLLKDSKFKGSASFTNLIKRARDAKGEDREGYRAEFIRLAERADVLSIEPEGVPVKFPRTPGVQVDDDN